MAAGKQTYSGVADLEDEVDEGDAGADGAFGGGHVPAVPGAGEAAHGRGQAAREDLRRRCYCHCRCRSRRECAMLWWAVTSRPGRIVAWDNWLNLPSWAESSSTTRSSK